MCRLWDTRRNAHHLGQGWGYEEGKGSMWPPVGVEDAMAGIEGLDNMLSSLTSWRAASSHEPLVASQLFASNRKLHAMLAWSKSVAGGGCNMDH